MLPLVNADVGSVLSTNSLDHLPACTACHSIVIKLDLSVRGGCDFQLIHFGKNQKKMVGQGKQH